VDLPNSRGSALYIPSVATPGTPHPFVLALHGAGIGPSGPITFLRPYAEADGFFLLSVGSRDTTWDVVRGEFGPDIGFIDRALEWAFERCAIDPARLTVEGFSDGASYALALGLVNGDLFRRVVAFSPGYVPPLDDPLSGHPEFFVSHGRQDPVLRIDCASRRIVPALEAGGYQVTYQEYDGVHAVPADIATQAVQWLTATRSPPAPVAHPFANPGPCILRPN
jgi:phospholipase/carboxylesterase